MKLKKVLVLLMAATMLVSSFVACEKKEDDETGETSNDISDTGTTIEIPSIDTGGPTSATNDNGGSGGSGGGGTSIKKPNNGGGNTADPTLNQFAPPPEFKAGNTVVKGISNDQYKNMFKGLKIRFYAAETWGHSYELYGTGQFYEKMKKDYGLPTPQVMPSVFGSDVLKNLNEINSGAQIDLIGYGHEKIPSVYNICQPINGYLDLEKVKKSNDIDHTLMEYTKKKNDYYFLPSLLREVFHYNAKMFKDKGLKEPFDLLKEGKWDWEHFEDYGKKFVKMGSNGKYDRQFVSIWEKTYYEFVLTNNAAIYSYDSQGKVTLNITDPNCKDALEYVNRIYADDHILKEFSPSEGYSYFSQSQTVPMIKIANAGNENKLVYGFVPMPKGPKGENVNTSMGIGYGLPQKQKYPGNSKKVLTFADLLNQANNALEKSKYLESTYNKRAEEMYKKTILGTKSAVMVLYGVGKASDYLQPITEGIKSSVPGKLSQAIEAQKNALALEAKRVWQLST